MVLPRKTVKNLFMGAPGMASNAVTGAVWLTVVVSWR
jgi:hypothetical protein